MALTKTDIIRLFEGLRQSNRKSFAELVDLWLAPDASGFDPTKQGGYVNGVFFPAILDARDAAAPGETIFVGDGTYGELDLLGGLEDNNYVMTDGAIFTGTIGDPTVAIFDTSTIATPANGYKGRITGGAFYSKPADASFVGIVSATNANDDMYFECVDAIDGGNTAFFADEGTITIQATGLLKSDGGAVCSSDNNGTIIVYADTIQDDNSAPLFAGSPGGTIISTARQILSLNSDCLAGQSSGTMIVTDFELIKTGDFRCIATNIGADLYLQGKRIENDSVASFTFESTAGYANVHEIANLSGQCYLASTAPAAGQVMEFSGSNIIGTNNNGGVMDITGGGTTKLLNTRVINSDLGPSADVLNLTNGKYILDDVILKTFGSGDSVMSPGPTNILVYGGVANTATGANVTEDVNALDINALVE